MASRNRFWPLKGRAGRGPPTQTRVILVDWRTVPAKSVYYAPRPTVFQGMMTAMDVDLYGGIRISS